ncbi:MAG TPA: glutamyl-tRNA reductase, partial [Rhodothermales bacterium]
MRIYGVGLDHRSCPLSVRERVSATTGKNPESELFRDLRGPKPTGLVVLSTCNRFEVYVHFEVDGGGMACSSAYRSITEFIALRSGLPGVVFAPYATRYGGRRAVVHLSRVAAGLESAIVGEPEILGQIGKALERSVRDGDASETLRVVFQTAVRAGRRARAETAIGRGSASLATAIADVVSQSSPNRRSPKVVVTGLGMIGGKVLRTLQERGVEVIPVNRTVPGTDKPAGVLAHDIGGLQGLLIDADVVVLATSSQEPVLTRSIMVDIMDNRGQRPLVIVDAGMPRNADPSVQEISGITLINLEAVAARTEGVLESRSRAAADVERIISEEADAFDRWRKNQESREIITALRRKADRIRRTEIRRAIERMPGLTQAAVEVL